MILEKFNNIYVYGSLLTQVEGNDSLTHTKQKAVFHITSTCPILSTTQIMHKSFLAESQFVTAIDLSIPLIHSINTCYVKVIYNSRLSITAHTRSYGKTRALGKA